MNKRAPQFIALLLAVVYLLVLPAWPVAQGWVWEPQSGEKPSWQTHGHQTLHVAGGAALQVQVGAHPRHLPDGHWPGFEPLAWPGAMSTPEPVYGAVVSMQGFRCREQLHRWRYAQLYPFHFFW